MSGSPSLGRLDIGIAADHEATAAIKASTMRARDCGPVDDAGHWRDLPVGRRHRHALGDEFLPDNDHIGHHPAVRRPRRRPTVSRRSCDGGERHDRVRVRPCARPACPRRSASAPIAATRCAIAPRPRNHDFGGLPVADAQIGVGHLDFDPKGAGGRIGGAAKKDHVALHLLAPAASRAPARAPTLTRFTSVSGTNPTSLIGSS